MERIRVIGRIDLAQQVHAALVAAGAGANLATAAPMAVIAATGRDDTAIDVIANDTLMCAGIKKAAPMRPVVVITWDEPGSDLNRRRAAVQAETARGPDAHLPWPATGAEILAACERAKAASRVRRPRFSARVEIVRLVAIAILVVLVLALASEIRGRSAGLRHGANPWLRAFMQLSQAGIFAASASWSWSRARTSRHPRWLRGWAVFAGLFAGLSFLGVAAILLE